MSGRSRVGGRPLQRTSLAAATIAAIVAFLAASWLHRGSALYDTDSYYHLAIARLYARDGLDAVPPLDASALTAGTPAGGGFGDKELLFHLGLVPFAAGADPVAGGRLALAVLAALVAATIAAVAARAVGLWGAAVALALPILSTEVAWRLVRLRPETVALALLVAGLAALGTDRARLLGLVSFLFTLSYTAFHAFLGVIGLGVVGLGWVERRVRWAALLYAGLGAGLALLVHPAFPRNLEVWWLVAYEYFRHKGELPVGTEIRPNWTSVTLLVNLGWGLAMLAIARAAARDDTPSTDAAPVDAAPIDADRALAIVFAVGTAVFGVLYLLMSRFSLYAFPLATLTLLFAQRARGERISGWTRLPWRGRIPLAAALAVAFLVATPEALRQLAAYRHRTDSGPANAREADRRAMAAAIPPGARVAADWGTTSIGLLWAPAARYLNALDPILVVAVAPELHRTLERALAGDEPDLPAAVVGPLGSDLLLIPTLTSAELLRARLEHDPRIVLLHRGTQSVYGFPPERNRAFLLDWRLAPPGSTPPGPGAAIDAWPAYPRAAEPAVRAREGFVDLARLALDPRGCATLVHPLSVETAATLRFELAAAGRATVWLDGVPLASVLTSISGAAGAVLGRGLELPLSLSTGEHRVTVEACRGAGEGRRDGFFLLARP